VKFISLTGIFILSGLVMMHFSACGEDGQNSLGPVQIAVYDKSALDYLLFVPQNVSAAVNGKFPLILSLHGIGERGSDLSELKRDGLPKILDGNTEFPFMVLSPQCPETTEWYYDRTDRLTLQTLQDVIAAYPVDTNRIYVTGYSMGGIGTWDFTIRYPDKIAAILPIAFRAETGWNVAAMKSVPVRAFHGENDDVIPLQSAQNLVNAFIKIGGQIDFTTYPGTGHDAWTKTYNNPDVYTWLLSRTR